MSNRKPVDRPLIRRMLADGMTQYQVAKELGVTHAWVSKVATETANESTQDRVVSSARNQIDLDGTFKDRLIEGISDV